MRGVTKVGFQRIRPHAGCALTHGLATPRFRPLGEDAEAASQPHKLRALLGGSVPAAATPRTLTVPRAKPVAPEGQRPTRGPSRRKAPLLALPAVAAIALDRGGRRRAERDRRARARARSPASADGCSATTAAKRCSVEVDERNDDLRRALSELEIAQAETVRRLSMAVEFRDEDTGAHIERIGRFSTLLAEAIGMSPDFCRRDRPRRAAARRRQGRDPRRDSLEARLAHRRGARDRRDPRRGGPPPAARLLLLDPRHGRDDRAQPPRALGRRRLPARPGTLRTSRSRVASWRSPTCSTRSPPTASTARPSPSRRRSR